MANRNDFDVKKLHELIRAEKTMAEIKAEMKITTATINNHLLKLIQQDEKVYKLSGSGVRNTVPKVTKNGLKISMTLLESYGFAKGDVKIERLGDKEIKISQTD